MIGFIKAPFVQVIVFVKCCVLVTSSNVDLKCSPTLIQSKIIFHEVVHNNVKSRKKILNLIIYIL